MKTVYILLLLVLTSCANDIVKNNLNGGTGEMTEGKLDAEENTISGLKIVTCTSKKYGKHIYVISDMYIMKKVRIYNTSGEKVLAVSTVGSPIYIAKMEKGNYKVEVIEGKRTEITDLVVK